MEWWSPGLPGFRYSFGGFLQVDLMENSAIGGCSPRLVAGSMNRLGETELATVGVVSWGVGWWESRGDGSAYFTRELRRGDVGHDGL